jgi:hypothetical protein
VESYGKENPSGVCDFYHICGNPYVDSHGLPAKHIGTCIDYVTLAAGCILGKWETPWEREEEGSYFMVAIANCSWQKNGYDKFFHLVKNEDGFPFKPDSVGVVAAPAVAGRMNVLDPRAFDLGLEENQCDFPEILDGKSVLLLSFGRRIAGSQGIARPPFEAIKKAGIAWVIDLHSASYDVSGHVPYLSYVDEGSAGKLRFLKVSAKHVLPSNGQHICHRVQYEGHWFIHFAVKDLENNKAFTPEKFKELMQEIDSVEKETGFSTGKMAFHCNDGLGLAPMVLTIRALWDIAKKTREAEMTFTCDFAEGNREKWDFGGAVNLANALGRIITKGCATKSAFTYSEGQLEAVRNFAQYLADNQATLFPANP